jgi:hypothetical protein
VCHRDTLIRPAERFLIGHAGGIDSACQCGVPPITRAAYALRQHPEKSNRLIADEQLVSEYTVRQARKLTAMENAVNKRVGRDGKARRPPEPAIDMMGWREEHIFSLGKDSRFTLPATLRLRLAKVLQ